MPLDEGQDHGAHGSFDARSTRWSWLFWAEINRDWLALAGAGLAGLAGPPC